jgi:hypothetical protein
MGDELISVHGLSWVSFSGADEGGIGATPNLLERLYGKSSLQADVGPNYKLFMLDSLSHRLFFWEALEVHISSKMISRLAFGEKLFFGDLKIDKSGVAYSLKSSGRQIHFSIRRHRPWAETFASHLSSRIPLRGGKLANGDAANSTFSHFCIASISKSGVKVPNFVITSTELSRAANRSGTG